MEEQHEQAQRESSGRRSTPRYSNPDEALESYTKKHDLDNRSYQ